MHLVGPVIGPVSYESSHGADLRFVSNDFASLKGRFVRWELAIWCATISCTLRKASCMREQELRAVAECFRDTICVAEQLECFDDATRLAHAAIRYFSTIATRDRRAEAVGYAASALTWLGRIERLAGRTNDALLHLGRTRSLGFGAEINAGPLRVSRAQWDSVVALEPKMAQSIAFDAAVELFSTLLDAGQYEEVVSLALVARRGRNDPARLEDIRKEAALSALCHLGCPDEALALSARYTMETRDENRLIFDLRRGEVLACFGDAYRARVLIESVCNELEKRWRGQAARIDEVWIAARATRLQALISDGISVEFHWTAMGEALFVGDVPLAVELLVRITEREWDEERREDACELLRAVAVGSGYRLRLSRELLGADDAPISARSPEERAPGFSGLVEALTTVSNEAAMTN